MMNHLRHITEHDGWGPHRPERLLAGELCWRRPLTRRTVRPEMQLAEWVTIETRSCWESNIHGGTRGSARYYSYLWRPPEMIPYSTKGFGGVDLHISELNSNAHKALWMQALSNSPVPSFVEMSRCFFVNVCATCKLTDRSIAPSMVKLGHMKWPYIASTLWNIVNILHWWLVDIDPVGPLCHL